MVFEPVRIMTNDPKVSIIILNWNGKGDTINCLRSLLNLKYSNYDIIVVDNGSTDGSQEVIRKLFPFVKLIENKQNLGFAEGNNVGIRFALNDRNVKYIFILNNDTKVDPNCLTELIKVAESESKIGIVQPKVLRMDNPKILDTTGHVFKFGLGWIVDRGSGETDRKQYDDKLDIIGGCACACLYKREMLEDIGFFDKSFDTYYEDAELSWRAYKKGWKAKYVPSAIVYHKRGGTVRKDKEIMLKMSMLCLRNMTIAIKRHGTLLQKFLFSLYLLAGAIKNEIRKGIKNGDLGGVYYIKCLGKLIFDDYFFNRWSNVDNYWRYYPVVKYINKSKYQVVCEVGCGKEGLAGYLNKKIFGVDIDFWGRPSKLVIPIKGSATNLPFRDNTFDVIVSIDLLEHIPREERGRVIGELLRVSKQCVILGCPCGDKSTYYEKKLNHIHKKLYGTEHKWLSEHVQNGLPYIDEIESYLKEFNCRYTKIKNVNNGIWYISSYIDLIMSKFLITKFLLILKNIALAKFIPIVNFGDTYRTIYFIDKKGGLKCE